VTNAADIALAQGKPWCITLILLINIYIYIAGYGNDMHIYLPMSLTSPSSSGALLRLSVV
jgi:hypothetical protein